MRKGLLVGVLVLFAGWFVWKALPFLSAARPEVDATPTVQPTDPTTLTPVAVKGGHSACLDRIPFGPDARYVQFTLTGSKRPASPLTIVARAPGYRAEAHVAAGTPGDTLTTVALPAARREVDGTLCFTNDGRHQVAFYGIPPGRGSSPSTTVVDGRTVVPELSITLLTSASRPLGARLGTIASHVAAFRPLTGWEVWLLGLLAVLGVPAAVAVALARAGAQDEAAGGRADAEGGRAGPGAGPDGGW